MKVEDLNKEEPFAYIIVFGILIIGLIIGGFIGVVIAKNTIIKTSIEPIEQFTFNSCQEYEATISFLKANRKGDYYCPRFGDTSCNGFCIGGKNFKMSKIG